MWCICIVRTSKVFFIVFEIIKILKINIFSLLDRQNENKQLNKYINSL